MSQLILQSVFRCSYVTGSSLTSPGEPPMQHEDTEIRTRDSSRYRRSGLIGTVLLGFKAVANILWSKEFATFLVTCFTNVLRNAGRSFLCFSRTWCAIPLKQKEGRTHCNHGNMESVYFCPWILQTVSTTSTTFQGIPKAQW